MSGYSTYLQTEHWQVVRYVKLLEQDYTCEKCGRFDCELNVHHLTYERKGRERLADLVVLCRNCHEEHHFHGMPLVNTPEEQNRRRQFIEAQRQAHVGDDGEPMELVDDGGWLDGQ